MVMGQMAHTEAETLYGNYIVYDPSESSLKRQCFSLVDWFKALNHLVVRFV